MAQTPVPLTLAKAADLAVDPKWIARITIALERAALEVIRQVMVDKMPPYTSTDIGKVVYARQVVKDVNQFTTQFAWLMAADITFTDPGQANDDELTSRLRAIWPLISDTGFGTTL